MYQTHRSPSPGRQRGRVSLSHPERESHLMLTLVESETATSEPEVSTW